MVVIANAQSLYLVCFLMITMCVRDAIADTYIFSFTQSSLLQVCDIVLKIHCNCGYIWLNLHLNLCSKVLDMCRIILKAGIKVTDMRGTKITVGNTIFMSVSIRLLLKSRMLTILQSFLLFLEWNKAALKSCHCFCFSLHLVFNH